MTTSSFRVAGMTCQHCVNAVTAELAAVDGVRGIAVELDPEGVSTVHVTSDAPLAEPQVAAALDEAGDYRLVTA